MHRVWIGLGALAGLGAVGMAALAAHAFGGLSPQQLRAVDAAVQMQGWHALALVATGLWAERRGGLANVAGGAFALGTLLFCGGVYGSVLGGLPVGAAAPVGGTVLMIGWLLLGVSALRR